MSSFDALEPGSYVKQSEVSKIAERVSIFLEGW